jgi:hypothetical protein
MIPKLAAAFVLGGIAVGSIIWFARPKPAPVAPPVVAVQALPRAETPPAEAPAPAPAPPPPLPAVPAPKPKAKPVVIAKTVPAPVAAPVPVQAPTAVVEPVRLPAPSPIVHNAEPAPPPSAILKPSAEVAPAAPPRQPQTVTIPAGTLITVRLRDTLRASRSSTDDPFQATLDQPIIVDGLVLAERGTVQRGRVIESVAAGRVKGRAALALELTQLTTSDGQKVEIRTETFRKEAESSARSDAAKAGVLAGIGAAIGAIAGGGKGAAIGAGAGGAAGAGAIFATKGKDAEIPSETRLTFRLKEPVTLTEKLN